MNAPLVFPARSQSRHSSFNARRKEDRLPYAAYLVISMLALIVGMILAQSNRLTLSVPPSPTSILPHPRSSSHENVRR